MKLYTFEEMAKLFNVKLKTIYNWRQKGDFEVFGYRRLGKWAKRALVSEEEVKRLQFKKYPKELRKIPS